MLMLMLSLTVCYHYHVQANRPGASGEEVTTVEASTSTGASQTGLIALLVAEVHAESSLAIQIDDSLLWRNEALEDSICIQLYAQGNSFSCAR